MIKEGLQASIIMVISTMGILLIFGGGMGLIEKWNNRYIQKAFGWGGIVITGCIGTVIHELSHFIMCILFRHKVKEIKVFRPLQSKKDGVLGYVNHSYNPYSTYKKVGNFFIGVAPIIVGTIVISLALKWLLLDSYTLLVGQIETVIKLQETGQWLDGGQLKMLGSILIQFMQNLFARQHLRQFEFYIYIVIMYSISTHMSLSREDLKGSLAGAVVLCVLLLIGGFGLYYYDAALFAMISFRMSLYLTLFLSIGIMFAVITLAISFIIFSIKKLVHL